MFRFLPFSPSPSRWENDFSLSSLPETSLQWFWTETWNYTLISQKTTPPRCCHLLESDSGVVWFLMHIFSKPCKSLWLFVVSRAGFGVHHQPAACNPPRTGLLCFHIEGSAKSYSVGGRGKSRYDGTIVDICSKAVTSINLSPGQRQNLQCAPEGWQATTYFKRILFLNSDSPLKWQAETKSIYA